MNLLEMLRAANRRIHPTLVKTKPKDPNGRSGNHQPDHLRASRAYTEQAVARYKKVMGFKWMKTSDIERALGHARASSQTFLKSRVTSGEIERRNAGGGAFNRRKGYEWRWVK